jgi:hypothetical protein
MQTVTLNKTTEMDTENGVSIIAEYTVKYDGEDIILSEVTKVTALFMGVTKDCTGDYNTNSKFKKMVDDEIEYYIDWNENELIADAKDEIYERKSLKI